MIIVVVIIIIIIVVVEVVVVVVIIIIIIMIIQVLRGVREAAAHVGMSSAACCGETGASPRAGATPSPRAGGELYVSLVCCDCFMQDASYLSQSAAVPSHGRELCRAVSPL